VARSETLSTTTVQQANRELNAHSEPAAQSVEVA